VAWYIKAILGFVFVILAIAAGTGVVVYRFLHEPASDSEAVVPFEVGPGETFKVVAKKLEQEGLVTDARKFELFARVSGRGGRVLVGEYAIRRNMRPVEVLGIISSGKSIKHIVTIPEGYNIFEIAELLERQGIAKREEFLSLVKDRALIKELLGQDEPSLEGYLFPETYHITKFTSARAFVRLMVERFMQNFAKLQAMPGWNSTRLSRHQLVTLASIVEKETGAPEERPVISSVFHNRLRLNMRLQTDPTVIYGIWEQSGEWNRNISREDLVTPTKYNTYTFFGLPAGPISNPGFEALTAAGGPARTEFLFFVSRNDGTHVFSRDYNQHRNAVSQFQLDRAAREGKSWRDLKSRESAPSVVKETLAPSNVGGGKKTSAPATKGPKR
jgi:UPF0755 protein